MSTKRLLLDYTNGIEEYIHIDEDDKDGTFSIESRQNCAPLLEHVRKLREMPQDREMWHMAEVPLEVLNQAFIEGWYHDKNKWKDWANDPANAHWRVREGRL